MNDYRSPGVDADWRSVRNVVRSNTVGALLSGGKAAATFCAREPGCPARPEDGAPRFRASGNK